jgi:hypothetical protein
MEINLITGILTDFINNVIDARDIMNKNGPFFKNRIK